MSVYIENKIWSSAIPYTFVEGMKDQDFADIWIQAFNRKVCREIFVPRDQYVLSSGDSTDTDGKAADYAEFVYSEGGESPIGRQGGKQLIKFHKTVKDAAPVQYTILHEMGHCAGLGHEQYNPTWRFISMLDGMHPGVYEANKNIYQVFQNRDCDYDSIMMYSLNAFGITQESLKAKLYPPVLQVSEIPKDEKPSQKFFREEKEKSTAAAEKSKQTLQFKTDYGKYFKKPGDLSATDIALIQHLYPKAKAL